MVRSDVDYPHGLALYEFTKNVTLDTTNKSQLIQYVYVKEL
jgi:hypothetical protein